MDIEEAITLTQELIEDFKADHCQCDKCILEKRAQYEAVETLIADVRRRMDDGK